MDFWSTVMPCKEQNISLIAEYIRQGEKTPTDFKLGVEIEHFIIDAKTKKSIGYKTKPGVLDILQKLSPKYEEEVIIDGALLGLKRKGSYLTLEPAAQLEVSLEPQRSMDALAAEYDAFRNELNAVLNPLGLMLATYGYHPASRIDELEMIPKTRYMQMAAYLPTKGRYALNMMKGTASVQVSIDYTSEDDFRKKFRLANCLSPFLYFMTDNTPYFEGMPVARHMLRARIWDEVDPERSGIVPGALDRPFGYREYAQYLYDRPAVVTHKDDLLSFTGEHTLSELFADECMSKTDIDYAIGMFFPDVRVRHYIEIRMADSLPKDYMLAYTALIKGLFYNENNLKKYTDVFAGFTNRDAAQLKADLIQKGNDAAYRDVPVCDFILQMLDDAGDVLGDEAHYLEAFRLCAKSKMHLYEMTLQ